MLLRKHERKLTHFTTGASESFWHLRPTAVVRAYHYERGGEEVGRHRKKSIFQVGARILKTR